MSKNKHTHRAPWHDYRSRCIYMLTLSKSSEVPSFGRITGNCHLPAGAEGACKIELSQLGRIVKNRIYNIAVVEPAIRLLQYAVMPDHVHMIVFVERPVDMHLGKIVAKLKAEINRLNENVPVFEEGFNDQILHPSRSLDTLYRYLRDNPRRLAVRREHPEYFRRVNGLEVAGRRVQAYGNLFLLRSPFKEQVVVHRADTDAVKAQNRERWLHTTANGGVLVSPFISPAEKAVRAEAVEAGGKIILITHEPMGERYKPAARDFALCEEGRLLIVSTAGCGDLSRAACMAMNGLAEEICKA